MRLHPTSDFNPRTPCGVRHVPGGEFTLDLIFQSTHPVWGATARTRLSAVNWSIFQSTHPVWGATQRYLDSISDQLFQSTHPVWGATDASATSARQASISIHAPRVGCDHTLLSCVPGFHDFNPRTPCGVRLLIDVKHTANIDFNPRTPCGVRRSSPHGGRDLLGISIHAPRVGCDPHGVGPRKAKRKYFNPRTPCGVRPATCGVFTDSHKISIHAPRVGCDVLSRLDAAFRKPFQSTHPVWGATCPCPSLRSCKEISIHAPRVGCDG